MKYRISSHGKLIYEGDIGLRTEVAFLDFVHKDTDNDTFLEDTTIQEVLLASDFYADQF
ncbi:MAG: hypothetical protein GDA52_07510 [Rhodobacteraceae bacterium]|nr:hypothetical protein [Paracoccaceae bacterium]